MVVGSQSTITKILADLSLIVCYWITIHMYTSKNLAVKADFHTAKFNSLPNFPAIYSNTL